MDPMLTALAVLAAQEVVRAMAGDGWQAVRDGVAGWMGRGDAARTARQAGNLDESREEVCDGRVATETATERWRGSFVQLLDEYPELADELRKVLALRAPAEAGAAAGGQVMTIHGSPVLNAHGASVAAAQIGHLTMGGPAPAGPSAPGRPQG
ncbi:hypothetical protein Val02_65230 [Virgisporangium aliadipatigenens]|uniref:Uncharacterized protein n=1 Tax=Virgisporangium aliadipatigenens TaxID=741659 RepID=A0A8J3YS46_9ACTN|nr:hypothetical protein [Virgisporangium aliadipatigenens]GIJ49637.1 hypothetical protein Val02_65230 [Virgisporangium aliadipatigenens]